MTTFLLEVGTEELPAGFLAEAPEQWRSQIPATLDEHFLTREMVEVYSTPRRLAVVVRELPAKQPDREEDIKGPPAQAAFKDGKPTKAAEGFARSRGVDLGALEIRPTEKGEFVFVRQRIAGRATAEILSELIPTWITGLTGRRFMRWGDGDLRFPRPIRWLVALLDDTVLSLQLENGSTTLTSDRLSGGHRVLHPDPVLIASADTYRATLRAAHVEVDPEQRAAIIRQQVEATAHSVNGWADIAPDLLKEVTNLVEWPTVVIGKFDAEFLSLPPEVITTVMVTHQRYFPVLAHAPNAASPLKLLPYFIAVANGDPAKADVIAAGNERVLRARLADGQFFYGADCRQPLESYVPRLQEVTFQEKLGSMREKVERLSQVAMQIAAQLQVTEAERSDVRRAAFLCKADLVTQMVGEFPELQGIMGEKYARVSGESDAVAMAIREHYLPRGAGDRPAQTLIGQVVGLADRIDTLVSIFGLGLIPTSSSDPFALRRAANAVIKTTWAANLPFNLNQLLQQVTTDFVARFSMGQPNPLLSSLQEFFIQRVQTLLQDERSIDYDLVSAVLGEGDPEYTDRALENLLDVRDRADYLQAIRNDRTLDQIYPTVNRATRLAREGSLGTHPLDPTVVIRPDLFQSDSERAFYQALVQLLPQTQAARTQRDYPQLVAAIAQIAPTVSEFFDGPDSVLVMDPNAEVRQNRLNLLGLLRNHARVLADFGPIVKP